MSVTGPRAEHGRRAQSRRPITAHEKQLWAEMAQLLMLTSLAQSENWQAKDLVFHGGTSLHLGWASPRFSEDLDFLLDKDLLVHMGAIMRSVVRRMEHHLLRFDADLTVDVRDRSTARMGRFNITISKKGVMGKSLVKTEFWGVDKSYLANYEANPRIAIVPDSMLREGMHVHLRSPLPMATLNSVFCDKLVAIAGRPYIKWRDVFDLWWISKSNDFHRPSTDVLAQRVQAYASAYRANPNAESHVGDASEENPIESNMAQRLRDYAHAIAQNSVLDAAAEELGRFLSDVSGGDALWDNVWKPRVPEMIECARRTAEEVAQMIDDMYTDSNLATERVASSSKRPRMTA